MKKPKLGQHFLTRPEIAGWVAQAIDISSQDTVLEIGPGKGILTTEILKVANTVVAVEKDTLLVTKLRETFSNEITNGNLILIEDDVRDFNPKNCIHLNSGYSLVANIPYYITGYILRKFLTTSHQPKNIAVLIQKEVAERIVAKNNKHSILSLSIHVFGEPRLEKIVKAGAFSPPPKVDSAILSIKNISRDVFKSEESEEIFFNLIKTAFSQKRKTLGATLKDELTPSDFAKCDIDKKTRPEDMSLENWLCFTNCQH